MRVFAKPTVLAREAKAVTGFDRNYRLTRLPNEPKKNTHDLFHEGYY